MENKRDTFFLTKKDKPYNKQSNQQAKRQQAHDNNRPVVEKLENNKQPKKDFDKKTYRLKKYSKKYKLDQWEEQRKKKLLKDYYKETKNEHTEGSYKPRTFDEDTTDSSEAGKYVRHPDLLVEMNPIANRKKDPFHRAKEEYNKIKQEKVDKKQQMEKVKEERTQKLQEYKKKKQERFKKLSKKTKKGQPVMTGRLEMLLEKIQKG